MNEACVHSAIEFVSGSLVIRTIVQADGVRYGLVGIRRRQSRRPEEESFMGDKTPKRPPKPKKPKAPKV